MEFKQFVSSTPDIITESVPAQEEGVEVPQYFGKSRVFWFRDNKPTITLGPHWLVFAITFCINVYLQVFFLQLTISKSSHLLIGIQIVYGLCQMFSYLAVAMTNPGLITNYDG